MARSNEEFVSAFSNLGSSEVVCEETINDLDLFTCRLFGDQTATTVNDARYNAFTKGKFGEDCLPPNKDALLLHITRANYVAYIWRRCLSPTIDAPDFCNHGWQVDESGDVRVKWLSCLPAMDNILESASCNCKTGCKNRRCKCKKEDLTCTELCGCTECENQKKPMRMFTRTLRWMIQIQNRQYTHNRDEITIVKDL